MTAKQYLRQAYRLNELINSHIREVEQLRLLSTSVPSTDFSKERVQGGKLPGDRISNIIAKIVDLEKQINDEIDRFVDLKKEIHDAVDNVKNVNEQLVLRYRYIEFLTWEQISERMNYSIMQVHRIHSNALRNFIIPKI
jgi:DNA-directed RNA polymerase specialized sigma subunit